jgi:hypothetical protein
VKQIYAANMRRGATLRHTTGVFSKTEGKESISPKICEAGDDYWTASSGKRGNEGEEWRRGGKGERGFPMTNRIHRVPSIERLIIFVHVSSRRRS